MKSDVPKIYGLIHFSTITRSECCVYGMPIIFPIGEIFRLRKGECFVFLTEYTHLNIYEPTNLAPVVNQVTTTYRALFEITISSHTFFVVKCMHFVLSGLYTSHDIKSNYRMDRKFFIWNDLYCSEIQSNDIFPW